MSIRSSEYLCPLQTKFIELWGVDNLFFEYPMLKSQEILKTKKYLRYIFDFPPVTLHIFVVDNINKLSLHSFIKDFFFNNFLHPMTTMIVTLRKGQQC